MIHRTMADYFAGIPNYPPAPKGRLPMNPPLLQYNDVSDNLLHAEYSCSACGALVLERTWPAHLAWHEGLDK